MTRIVFMGTSLFAVPILQRLSAHYQLAAVYTRPDKPAGRGKHQTQSPVKTAALELGLPILQPTTLRDEYEQQRLREIAPDLIVVAAYGLILPQAALEIPPRGCLNVHASLLPRWRGASPITFALLAGDREAGVTLMQMDVGLDTGPILAARVIPIEREDTAASLTEKLSVLGAQLLEDSLPAYLAGALTPVPQDNSKATMSRLVTKEDGLIDWRRPAEEIERMVRAYYPWPSAYTFYPSHKPGQDREDQRVLLKILRASVSEENSASPPGTVVRLARGVGVSTGQGVLELKMVQLAGKRPMEIEEFTRGQRSFIGTVLSS